MESVSRLGHIEVLNARGRPVFFRDLWQGRTTVLALVRHFGCLFCHEHAAALLNALPTIQAEGGHLVVLGNGSPVHLSEFMHRVGLDDHVYTDPGRLIYRALSMRHGLVRTVNIESSRHVRRAFAAGYRQRDVRGDRWQQGGTLVIEPDGRIAFVHRSEVAGDHVPISDVLVALRRSIASQKAQKRDFAPTADER